MAAVDEADTNAVDRVVELSILKGVTLGHPYSSAVLLIGGNKSGDHQF